MTIPKRKLGKTGEEVTVLGLGGEGILRTFGYEEQAYRLINRAIDLGINYFESARAYSGSETYYGLSLQETLKNMKTDHLDLWQIHDVRTLRDVDEIFGSGGALEAFVEAKEKGLTRYIGVTGHHDPSIIEKCLDNFDFDTVLIPVNPAEPFYRSFTERVLPAAVEKGIGTVAMKVYVRGFVSRIPGFTSMEPFFRFALSHPVTTAVIGCDTVQHLEENVGFAQSFLPLSAPEKQELIDGLRPFARRIMYYKP